MYLQRKGNKLKITKARITRDNFLRIPAIIVTLEDGTEEVLFTYYPDEISFTPDEFIGLTKEEGRGLKFDKDKAYLQS